MATVIVGGGPMGLIAAIKLKKLGVKDVVVVDPLVDRTRPGILDAFVYKRVGKAVDDEKDIKAPSSVSQFTTKQADHIKILERQLIAVAKKNGVEIEESEFTELKSDGVKVKHTEKSPDGKDEKVEERPFKAKFVFDATGNRREVVKKVGEPSDIIHVGSSPVERHFQAHVKMKPEDFALLAKPLSNTQKPLWHTLALEKLRKDFGWPHFAEPYIRFKGFEKDKVMLNFEIPPGLKEEQYKAWLDALLFLKTGKEMTFEPLKKSKEGRKPKPRFNPYPAKLTKLDKFHYEGPPAVLPIGDTMIDPYAPLGHGIGNGIDRLEILLSPEVMTIRDGEIVKIDYELYEKMVAAKIEEHEKAVLSSFKGRQIEITAALNSESINYRRALADAGEKEKPIIQNGLNQIRLEQMKKIIKQGSFDCEKAVSSSGDFKLDLATGEISNKEDYFSGIKLLMEAYATGRAATEAKVVGVDTSEIRGLLENLEVQITRAAEILVEMGDKISNLNSDEQRSKSALFYQAAYLAYASFGVKYAVQAQECMFKTSRVPDPPKRSPGSDIRYV
jgi:hypothetical protein